MLEFILFVLLQRRSVLSEKKDYLCMLIKTHLANVNTKLDLGNLWRWQGRELVRRGRLDIGAQVMPRLIAKLRSIEETGEFTFSGSTVYSTTGPLDW